MRISDWSSDVCSSDLRNCRPIEAISARFDPLPPSNSFERSAVVASPPNKCTIFVILCSCCPGEEVAGGIGSPPFAVDSVLLLAVSGWPARSEEHTSELQSLMRISYAVFCLKKKKITNLNTHTLHVTHTHTN